jgi:acetyltransferase-like isoleucine patch superfamily enzyme
VIGDGCIVHDQVEIRDRVVVEDYCVLGAPASNDSEPLIIGEDSRIRSHTVLYAGSDFSGGVETGHHVLVRDGARAGCHLRVGSFNDIEGDCEFGDWVRLHSYAHVGRGSKVGHFVWIYSLVTLTNDPLPVSSVERPVTVGDGAVLCVGTIVLPGAVIGKGAFAAAGSRVRGEIPPGAFVHDDCRIGGHVSMLHDPESGITHPWMRHASERYPEEAQPRLKKLLEDILATR